MAIITNSSAFLQALQYGDLDTDEKALVDALIAAGIEWIERYCDRTFEAATYTDETRDGTGENCIFVDNPPINSLTDVDIIYGDTTETYLATKFDYHSGRGEIRFKSDTFLSGGGSFPEGFQNIKITYNGGFATVPKIVQKITADFVLETFDPSLVDNLIEKEKLGDYFYSKGSKYFENLNFSTRRLLSSYRLRKAVRG